MLEVNEKTWPFFRFKTLEEFGGERPYFWNNRGAMDYLFGRPCREIGLETIVRGGSYMLENGWTIHVEHLTPISTMEEIE